MRIARLRIGLHDFNRPKPKYSNDELLSTNGPIAFTRGLNNYFSEAIEADGKYFYQIDGTTVELELYEYERVIANPILYYFSTALKLHFRVLKAKDLGLGPNWPNTAAAPLNIFEIYKTNN